MLNQFESRLADSVACSRCCQRLPETEFRRRSRTSNVRMHQCRNCHASYERQRRQIRREEADGLKFQKAATAMSRAPHLERISSILNVLIAEFGGPNGLYQFWLDEIERLKQKRRPGFRLLRFCEMLANIEFLRDTEILERRKRLHSPEWRAAVREEFLRLIAEHPEIVREVADSAVDLS